MLRWDWRPACERRGGVWECVCTTVLWGRGLYDDFELLFFGGGGLYYYYSFFLGVVVRSFRRDRFPPHCLRHCTTCSSLSASHSLRRSEALGVVLAALEAQPSQWCGGPQDRRTPVASSVSSVALCSGVVAVCRTVQHNVSLGLTHPATTPVAGPMCVPNDRPLSGLPWHPSAGCHGRNLVRVEILGRFAGHLIGRVLHVQVVDPLLPLDLHDRLSDEYRLSVR